MKNNCNSGTKIVDRLKSLISNPVSELEFRNNFELLIAVMLSAQCTDKRVNLITRELFKKYKEPKDYLTITIEELESMIKSCNYYHNKAKNIIETCKILVDKFDGQVPSSHKELISLKGVGNKTANVVLAVGFQKQAFPVDTHILRVSNRLGLVTTKNPTDCEKGLVEIFDGENFGQVHHLMLLFGRYYCTARNPKCNDCVLNDICKHIQER